MRENKKRLGAGLAGLLMMTTGVLGVVTQASPADASLSAGSRVTAKWSGALRTGDKAAVNSAYWSRYASKLDVSIGWLSGSILGCLPGLSSLTSRSATLSSLNFVRSMAGLAPVSFSSTMNANAQRAALIMDANDALNHNPSSSWRCYSKTGAATASKSNLAMAWPSLKSGQIIDLYMDDRGSQNTAVGHRRWVLNPFTTVMGSGSTSTANALTVVGPTNAYRPNPSYVGWPTAGYFPNTMEPGGRWSLSAGRSNTNFTYARVTVYNAKGARVPIRKYAVHSGYAQPTVVWQMPSTFPTTSSYHVVVTGIRRSGTTKVFSHDYWVKLFTPYK